MLDIQKVQTDLKVVQTASTLTFHVNNICNNSYVCLDYLVVHGGSAILNEYKQKNNFSERMRHTKVFSFNSFTIVCLIRSVSHAFSHVLVVGAVFHRVRQLTLCASFQMTLNGTLFP